MGTHRSPLFSEVPVPCQLTAGEGKFTMAKDTTLERIYPFFGIVSRDSVRILLKHITESIHPVPNHTWHAWAKWDAFIWTSDPDALYAEYQSRGLVFHESPRGYQRRSPSV